MEFNKPILRAMRVHLETVLIDFEKKFDVKVSVGSMRYSETNAKIPLSIDCINDDGVVETKEVVAFKNQAQFYGLSPDNLHQEFAIGKDTYKITGLNTSAKKYPIQAIGKDGKRYKFAVEQVKMFLSSEQIK